MDQNDWSLHFALLNSVIPNFIKTSAMASHESKERKRVFANTGVQWYKYNASLSRKAIRPRLWCEFIICQMDHCSVLMRALLNYLVITVALVRLRDACERGKHSYYVTSPSLGHTGYRWMFRVLFKTCKDEYTARHAASTACKKSYLLNSADSWGESLLQCIIWVAIPSCWLMHIFNISHLNF